MLFIGGVLSIDRFYWGCALASGGLFVQLLPKCFISGSKSTFGMKLRDFYIE